MTTTSSSFLINATGEPVSVLVNGSPVLLMEIPAPRLIGAPPKDTYEPVSVCPYLDRAGGEVELEVWGELIPIYTEDRVPPVEENVMYLVTEESYAQFPYRPDFVCPAAYRIFPVEAKKKKGKKRKKKGKDKKGKNTWNWVTVLSAVTYQPRLVIYSEADMPISVHDEEWVEVPVPTVMHDDWMTPLDFDVEFPENADEPTPEEVEARLASDHDFFYGPGGKPVENSLLTVLYRDEATESNPTVVTVESAVASPIGWVKGTGDVSEEDMARMAASDAAVRALFVTAGEANGDTEDDENHPT